MSYRNSRICLVKYITMGHDEKNFTIRDKSLCPKFTPL